LQTRDLNIGPKKELVLTAYANDIVVIAETEESLNRTTKIVIDAAKKIGLTINKKSNQIHGHI